MLLGLSALLAAQAVPALPPWGTFQGGKVDSIDLANLQLRVTIPLINKREVGRLAEAYTGTPASKITDEAFTYGALGHAANAYQNSPNSSGACISTETYTWPSRFTPSRKVSQNCPIDRSD